MIGSRQRAIEGEMFFDDFGAGGDAEAGCAAAA